MICVSCIISRRFTRSFENLRLEQLKIKRSRNSAKLAQFENQIFEWPNKDETEQVSAASQATAAQAAEAVPPARAGQSATQSTSAARPKMGQKSKSINILLA